MGFFIGSRRSGVLSGLLVLAFLAVVGGTARPALVWAADTATAAQAARLRAHCCNNLKQLGLVFKIFSHESKGQRWPELSPEKGRLMCANQSSSLDTPLHPEFLTDLSALCCPADKSLSPPQSLASKEGLAQFLNDQSYFYLGYVVTSDEEVEAFAAAYRSRMNEGLAFDEDLEVPQGKGNGGSDTLYLLREGIERFLITDINDPGASAKAADSVAVVIERPGNHQPKGGNVLFLDGHVEFIEYPGKWPMTEATIETLLELDALGKDKK